ncbi:MAG: TROVE domain-containing protein [Cellvibrio sp. 79]|nr:MAG: TROVE domain-containing protein [Cellvibrio sp. 79]
MQINRPSKSPLTHEGAPAIHLTPLDELKRTVMACMLWEDNFYESGSAIADRIRKLVSRCNPREVANLAIEAREKQRLRHVPLLIVRELARYPHKCPDGLIANTLERIIQRADELTEFLALYWCKGKIPISKQVKKGLARAFTKFNEYALAKYNRKNAIKLRDVLFMVHAKPKDEAQAALWKRLIDAELATPDTWEVALSAGADKGETFTRLITEKKLGYLALLRNLRNMQQSGVSTELVFNALMAGAETSKALPFRYVAAARAVPAWEPQIDQAMQIALSGLDKLPGKTIVLIDVSGSMDAALSQKSDLTRLDAASALAVLIRGICKEVRVFTFSEDVVEVPPRNGMALVDAITVSQPHGGTYLGRALESLQTRANADRIIVITDEQSSDPVGNAIGHGYMINVASYKNGIGYGDWIHINGFSESIVDYLAVYEKTYCVSAVAT